MTRGSVPRVNDNMHAGEYVCFDKAVIIRPQAPPPGRQTQKGSALRWGPQLLSQLPHPNGTSPRLGEHMPPAGGNQQKRGGRELHTPQDLLPRRQCKYVAVILQTVPSYKPSYKPCTAPREFVQTAQTVHQGGLLSNTPNRNGLYGLYEFPKRRARFV